MSIQPGSVGVVANASSSDPNTSTRDIESTLESLSIAEQRYAAAAEASHDGLVLLRARRNGSGDVVDLELLDCNRRACELLGADCAALQGRNLCELFPAVRGLGYFEKFVQVLETGAPYQDSVQGHPLGITTTWIRWQAVALGDGIAISICDVSHERELMAQLAQSRRLESIGSLAVGIAHDFNNMLSAILGFGGLALESAAQGTKAHADIEQVMQAAQRATQLTRYLLAFASRQELEPKAVDPSKSVRDIAPILSRLAGPAIELSLDLQTTQLVQLDPCQFEQAIVNLVANARDAMPEGGKLSIDSRCVSLRPQAVEWADNLAPGEYLCISVVDSGTGMDEATRARIFEPFFTTKAPNAGTGLGLASVYGFVRQSKGLIRVDSEVNQGTVVRLYFPLAHGVTRKSSAPPPRISGAVMRHAGRVLLVERDEFVRSVVRRILTQDGYEVLDAADPSAAESILDHQGGVDVLLTAMRLPHVTGLELARRLKMTWPEIGVVLMSGAADMRLVEHANHNLGALFVQKPFTAAALLGKVHEARRLSLLGPDPIGRCRQG